MQVQHLAAHSNLLHFCFKIRDCYVVMFTEACLYHNVFHNVLDEDFALDRWNHVLS